MTPDRKPPEQKQWSSKADRIRYSFSGSHRRDSVEELEEDAGLDSSSQYGGAELPMDSPERQAAMEAEEKRREDDE